MANGDDDRGLAPVPPGMKRYTVRNKAGDSVNIIGPVDADPERIKQKGAEAFAKRNRLSTADIADAAKAFPRGVVKGFMSTPSLFGAMGRAEIEAAAAPFGGARDLPAAPSAEQLTQAVEYGTGVRLPKPQSGAGAMSERVGEFVGDPASWIGPGGPIIKATTAVTGGIGSYLGERYGGAPGSVLGALAGGGVTGALSPRGLPARVPRAVREATTEEGVRAASKGAYQEMGMLQYNLSTLQAGQLRDAIIAHLSEYSPSEQRPLFTRESAPTVFKHVEQLSVPSAMPGTTRQFAQITVNDVERVRQQLVGDRMMGGAEAVAASDAIEAIDEYLLNLPGVAGITERARKNWAAYKRGQIVEETIRRATDRAGSTGTGANFDNVLRQEFKNRIRNKEKIWKAFSPREQQEIEKIMHPGVTLDIARYLSRFGPRHIMTGGPAAAGAAYFTHDPLAALVTLTGGEAAHHVAEFMQTGRARRLAELTRARSPVGGYYTPRPYPTRATTGAAGAARALGATALSPEATEAIELPEITVRPQ